MMCRYKKKCWGKKQYKYDIDVDSERIIDYVEFDYRKNKRKKKKAIVWLLADGEATEKKRICQCPCRWDLNKKVTELKLVSTKRLKPKYMNIEVVYQEEEWVKLDPGDSYPLPTEPPEISKITFEAKTDAGTSSVIDLFAYGDPFKSVTITSTLRTIPWDLEGGPYSIQILSLINTGSSTIYIRNFTTE